MKKLSLLYPTQCHRGFIGGPASGGGGHRQRVWCVGVVSVDFFFDQKWREVNGGKKSCAKWREEKWFVRPSVLVCHTSHVVTRGTCRHQRILNSSPLSRQPKQPYRIDRMNVSTPKYDKYIIICRMSNVSIEVDVVEMSMVDEIIMTMT